MSDASRFPFGELMGPQDMIEFEARAFVVVAHALGMLQINMPLVESYKNRARDPEPLFKFFKTKIEKELSDANKNLLGNALDNETISRRVLTASIKQIYQQLGVLDCPIAMRAVERLAEQLFADNGKKINERDIQEVFLRIVDEISSRMFFSIKSSDQKYFAPDENHFGDEVKRKFPTASFEIDESAKCLGLGRATASVFHLMRTMEIGVRAVARCLMIDDPMVPSDRNWGNIIKAIKTGMDVSWPKPKDRMDGDGAFFESIHASLDAVKNPWRNGTMHVEKTYTVEEAENIFAAVRAFMVKLSSRCDELGLPKVQRESSKLS